MPTTVPVELYRTIERANAAAKAAATATAPGAAFGARRLTAAGLVEELWELWGDGRVLVSAEERSLLAARTASICDAAAASGAPSVLAAFAAEHAAALADERAVPVAELTSLQRGLVACLRSYHDELAARNLIEADEAADLLASMVEDGRLPAMGVTVCDCLDVSGGLRHLLTALGASAEGDEALAAVSCLPEDVEPGVLIAAGAAAMPGLLLDEIGRAGRAGRKKRSGGGRRPCRAVRRVGSAFVRQRLGGGASGHRALEGHRLRARLGKCARRLEEGSPHWLEAATDFAYNPFSGIAGRKARESQRASAQRPLTDCHRCRRDPRGGERLVFRSGPRRARRGLRRKRSSSYSRHPFQRRRCFLVGRAGACRRARRLRQALRSACPGGGAGRVDLRADAAACRCHAERRGLLRDGRPPLRNRRCGRTGLARAEKLGCGDPGGRQRAHLRHLREPIGFGRPRRDTRTSPRAFGALAPALAVRGGTARRPSAICPGREPARRAGKRAVSLLSAGRVRERPGPGRRRPGLGGRR